jgi:hypothetical protein
MKRENAHVDCLSVFFSLESVNDAEQWRRQLSSMASMIGLFTADELANNGQQNPSANIQRTSSSVTRLVGRSSMKSSDGEYSQRTGRWNETPRMTTSRNRSSSSRCRTLSGVTPSRLFCVGEQEREVWVGIKHNFFF